MKKLRKATILLILFSFLGLESCIVLPIQSTSQKIPISYSDLPVKTIRSFDRRIRIRFWGNKMRNTEFSVDQIIAEELSKTPNASGIKNLRVRILTRSWDSCQCMNSFGAIKGIYGTLLGFTWRSVQITGDIY